MKKHFHFSMIILLAGILQNTYAQQRYFDEVFSGVNVTPNIVYGQNNTVLYGYETPVLQNLVMDVYEPEGDTSLSRPLVIYIHTGQFLPLLLNETPGGDKADSATTEMCKRFARRGYVASSMDYRGGWNPGATQDIRTGTILLAVYRAIQDAKACVRYFRMNAATLGNTYKIDTSRIILCGQGSGGYVALAYNSLDKVAETQLLKFIAAETDPNYYFVAGQSYVDQAIWGDFDGFGGTTGLSFENWPGYSNKVCMVVNMGGAIGDSTWIEEGDAPIVAFHPVNDPFAPYETGPVIVPTTGQFVIEVSGSYDVLRICNDPTRGDNNAVFDIPYNDPYTARANSINDGHEGLFPFVLPDPGAPFFGQVGPWEWWDVAALQIVAPSYGIDPANVPAICGGALLTNPDMSKLKAMKYIDTIQGYLAPRMVQACQLPGFYSSVNDVQLFNVNMQLFPNPSVDYFTLKLEDPAQHIQFVQLFDIRGVMVKEIRDLDNNTVKIDRDDLSTGFYLVKIGLKGKSIHGKLIFE